MPRLCSPAAACDTCPVWEDPWTAGYRSSVPLTLHGCFWMQMVFKDLNWKVAVWATQSLVLVWFPGSRCCRGQLCRFLLVTCTFESSVVFINPSLTRHKQKLLIPNLFLFCSLPDFCSDLWGCWCQGLQDLVLWYWLSSNELRRVSNLLHIWGSSGLVGLFLHFSCPTFQILKSQISPSRQTRSQVPVFLCNIYVVYCDAC